MTVFLELFVSFFKVGAFAFGGGLAMLPLIFQEVARYGMMTETEFSRLVALSQVTPGPVAVNAATYVGMIYAGVPGAIVATLCVSLPSFAVMIIAMKFIDTFKENKGLQAALDGIRPATVGLIGAAFVYLAQTSIIDGKLFSTQFLTGLPGNLNIFPLCVFVAVVVLSATKKLGPIPLILFSGVAGAIVCGMGA